MTNKDARRADYEREFLEALVSHGLSPKLMEPRPCALTNITVEPTPQDRWATNLSNGDVRFLHAIRISPA